MAGMSQSPWAECMGRNGKTTVVPQKKMGKDGKDWKSHSLLELMVYFFYYIIYIYIYLFWDPDKYHVAVKLGNIN